MQESIINLTKDKNMSDVLCGKVWFGAFEDVVCVANFDMPNRSTIGPMAKCEEIYRATQNIMDSWSLTAEQLKEEYGDTEKKDGASWITPTNMIGNRGHRSMSVGDVVQFGRDDDKKTYWAVAGFGFTELTYDEYSRWCDTDSRDRDMFVRDIVKAKEVEELIAKEEALVN